jgi:hypothetical protein
MMGRSASTKHLSLLINRRHYTKQCETHLWLQVNKELSVSSPPAAIEKRKPADDVIDADANGEKQKMQKPEKKKKKQRER